MPLIPGILWDPTPEPGQRYKIVYVFRGEQTHIYKRFLCDEEAVRWALANRSELVAVYRAETVCHELLTDVYVPSEEVGIEEE